MTEEHKDAVAFKKEFYDLLKKYKAEMVIAEHCEGYHYVTDGIEIQFDSIYDDEYNEVRPNIESMLPRYLYYKHL